MSVLVWFLVLMFLMWVIFRLCVFSISEVVFGLI